MSETVTIGQVFDELKKIESNMITKDELERFFETVEILNNPEVVRQLKESKEDIRYGKFKAITSVNDLLSEV